MTYFLFDVGGTWTHFALGTSTGEVSNIKRIKTPSKPQKFIELAHAFVDGKSNISNVAGGVRGVLTEDKVGIEHDHILTGWVGYDLKQALSDAFSADVVLENDAAIAGLGEAHYGVGKGADVIVYHDVSTGVGGARIVHGILDSVGLAFEPGLQIIDIDKTVLGPGVPPTLENLVSGKAVAERMGMPAQDIPQEDVIWHDLAEYLASGLRNSILYWSPEMIVLGGAMMYGNPGIPLDAVRQETVRVLDGVVQCPFITLGSLKQDAGLYGALALLTK